jgi:O-antigen/teichoic acid export membrane protein
MIRKIKLLKGEEGFMKYFKNTSWLFAEKVLRMIMAFFVGVWVIRYLGPEQFGLFSYAQSIVGIFAMLSTLGLDSIVTRELAKKIEEKNNIIGTAIALKMAGAVLSLVILAGFVSLTSSDLYVNVLIFIIASAMIFQTLNVIDFFFQAKVLSKYVALVNSISLLISSVIKVFLILNEAPLIAFGLVVLFDSFVLAVGFIYIYIKKNSLQDVYILRFNKAIAINLLRDSWPMILNGVAVSIYMKIDQIMIKEILDVEAVGQYAAAVRLSEVWHFIPVIVTASIFPAIISSKERDKELYYLRLQRLYSLMVWSAIIIAIPITFLSDWLVALLYGNQYTQTAGVLMIHIWIGIFAFVGIAFGKYLIAENLTKKHLYKSLFGMVLNVGFNYFLIPKYGINGAAIGTLIGLISANYIYDIFDKKLHHQLKMKIKAFSPIYIIKGRL